jgi:hypothetical protein
MNKYIGNAYTSEISPMGGCTVNACLSDYAGSCGINLCRVNDSSCRTHACGVDKK